MICFVRDTRVLKSIDYTGLNELFKKAEGVKSSTGNTKEDIPFFLTPFVNCDA